VSILSNIISLIIGILIGVLSTFWGNRLLDKRRKKDLKKDDENKFKDISSKMPELIKEMKDDFIHNSKSFSREFFVLKTKGVVINSPEKSIAYYEDEHENLRSKISLLETSGYIYNSAEGQTLKYHIREEFLNILSDFKK